MIYQDIEKLYVHLRGMLAVLVLLVVSVAGCSSGSDMELPPGSYAYSMQFEDPLKQEKLIRELERQNLPYVIDDHGSGSIGYMLVDQAKVLGIYRKIRNRGKEEFEKASTSETLLFTNHPESLERKLRFLAELNAHGIHYQRSSNGNNWSRVSWRVEDGPQVDQIRQDLECSLRTADREARFRDEGLTFDSEACRSYTQ